MKIAVTGGSGFIGSHIVDKLKADGHDVLVLDIKNAHRSDVGSLNLDLLDFKKTKEALKDVDCVYHLAAVANVNDAFNNPILTVKLNSLGTVNVLEACRQNDIKRIIFASTVWVYGGARETDVHEDSPFFMPGAGHIYTSTKIASELFIHDYATLYGLPFTILRYGIPYGPRGRSGTVMPVFIEKALKGEPLTIFGDGSQYRNFVYIEDLANGNILALKDAAKNQTYNLEGDKKITVKEVAETIKRILGNVKIEYKEARPGDYKGKIVSNLKAKKELDWIPKVSFEEGMRRYIEWYKKQG